MIRLFYFTSLKGTLGALTRPKLHANIITESFYCYQKPFKFTIIFCVLLQIIHIKHMCDPLSSEFTFIN